MYESNYTIIIVPLVFRLYRFGISTNYVTRVSQANSVCGDYFMEHDVQQCGG
ncbi:MAG: hypothetical protein E7J99_17415 [Clostridium butyricum]|nr:hypothetical protein [Clostridium butyricum]